ncbi:MAG TPA: nicotinate (nicotinamide) nucleotide adenylyltransferase [Solirubrobacteraceae bacterium]
MSGAREPRLGILGGTFNPPHRGHLVLARRALSELLLDSVTLMPSNLSPHKRGQRDPGGEHRLEMCRLLVDRMPGLEVSDRELKHAGVSYTVDTLRGIKRSHPDAQLTFILGADIARTLRSWREPQDLLELAELAVAQRSGIDGEQLVDALAPLHTEGRIRFLEMPRVDVSSSQVRALLAEGSPVAHLVGEPIAAYISEHGLYGSEKGK